jgi:hypothetical protein
MDRSPRPAQDSADQLEPSDSGLAAAAGAVAVAGTGTGLAAGTAAPGARPGATRQ